MNPKVRRKFKKIFPGKNESFLDSFQSLCLAITITTMVVFVITHLVINFVLTPKGIELENLAQEKNFLVENNRELGQEIARIKSISIVKEITSEKMSLESVTESEIIYISNESVVAGF